MILIDIPSYCRGITKDHGIFSENYFVLQRQDIASIKSLLTHETLRNYRHGIWKRDGIIKSKQILAVKHGYRHKNSALRPPVLNVQSLPEMAQVLRPPGT